MIDVKLDCREEWEAHISCSDGSMFSIWVGHVRGSFYGNISLKKDDAIYEVKRGFHMRKELFDFYLSMPLDWKKIIDAKVFFGKNEAPFGIDLDSRDFNGNCLSVEDLSLNE